ncbi:YezD family protein [Terribacillus sp. 179-K 1B1 HS]
MSKENGEKWEEIIKKVDDLQYGTVLITVHDNEIKQADITEKIRFI